MLVLILILMFGVNVAIEINVSRPTLGVNRPLALLPKKILKLPTHVVMFSLLRVCFAFQNNNILMAVDWKQDRPRASPLASPYSKILRGNFLLVSHIVSFNKLSVTADNSAFIKRSNINQNIILFKPPDTLIVIINRVWIRLYWAKSQSKREINIAINRYVVSSETQTVTYRKTWRDVKSPFGSNTYSHVHKCSRLMIT